jgi:Flp pilus assembly protein TadG
MSLCAAVRASLQSLRDDGGASLVEFAVSAAVLLMMIFAIIQVSLALYAYNYVSDAAREATRYAMVRGTACTGMPDCNADAATIQTFVRSVQYPGIDKNNLTAAAHWFRASQSAPTTWTVECAVQCAQPGNAVQVQVTYTYPLYVPFWKDSSVNISSVSQVVISN